MEVGTLLAEAFKVWLGNSDVMAFVLGFTLFITFILVTQQIYNDTRS
ncbi:hypothetical protein [Desertibacillus haloalkaliphilus]|nr:hypothetical protein [Desertibacillus haloalkaliphilus]MBU8905570.1 hypothetical protein [Desertibacillus haloalkaliphilus]